jgi:RHH-type rel operon transcriptional repressor/antitoxin RelB
MTISLRVSVEEETLIRNYANIKKMTVSEVMRQAIIEQIESEYDLKLYNEAVNEYKKNPVTYTLDEVERELGLR